MGAEWEETQAEETPPGICGAPTPRAPSPFPEGIACQLRYGHAGNRHEHVRREGFLWLRRVKYEWPRAYEDPMRLLTGGDSGEHVAREMLLRALGPGWNVEQVIDRREGDTLTLTTPRGETFAVRAGRIYLEWLPRGTD